jgi:hypothetical protein
MSTIFAERPHFFEGQYLGAEDLDILLRYSRERSARHALGAHTLGIVAGVDLVSRVDPAGAVEHFLSPGVVVDGYGRLIVVLAPAKLEASLFAQQPSGLVNVWIRYHEASAGGVRRGFEVCDAVDAYARVSESFRIEVGLKSTIAQREGGVALGDLSFSDAREALGNYLPGKPIACDGSVAAQLFPTEDDPDLWLVPVGRVAWTQGNPGSFAAADETGEKQSLLFRRQAGIVAESVIAANGLLRLRARWVERVAGQTVDQVCQSRALRETDLVKCGERVRPLEPIWLEEHARLKGDARLFGTRIEWQEALGTDYLAGGIPLAIRRRPERNEQNGHDLQVLLGKRVTGPNRLVIGAAQAKGDPCQIEFDFTAGVAVQDDGKVGIGTEATALVQPLTIRTVGDNGDAIGLQGTNGAIAWQINFGPGKAGLNFTQSNPAQSSFFIGNNGNVGIGTLTPTAKLDVQQVPVAPGNALGAAKWFQLSAGGDSGRVWFQYGSQLAPLMVMSDLDDAPRIQFQQIGNAQENAPQFQSWIGHARGNSSDIALFGGNVGVGTITPARTLHAEGSEIHSGGGGGGYSFANRATGNFVESPANGERWVLYAQDGAAHLWSSGNKMTVTPQGRVGVGTATPAESLDVRGNVKLGGAGNYFALGALDNLRVIAGAVPEAGNAVGTGWQAIHLPLQTGVYTVIFSVPFNTTPIVVATLVEPLAEDNTICVRSLSAGGFTVVVRDITGTAATDGTTEQDSAFNFIALGGRA